VLIMGFTPCQGKTACRDDGERCLTCGRRLEEIVWLRDLLDQMTSLAIEHGYDNIDEFAAYIAYKLPKMVGHRRQQLTEQADAC
jgi:hypothetical protein